MNLCIHEVHGFLAVLSASQPVDSIASSAICWLSPFELKLVSHSDKQKEMERMVSATRKDHIPPPPPVKVLSLSLMKKDPKH